MRESCFATLPTLAQLVTTNPQKDGSSNAHSSVQGSGETLENQ
jgi:hypothetical protein